MAIPVRVIDTGVRDGRLQIAFDQAMIDLHREGVIPDTIRFLRFAPSALIGRHQAIGQEIKTDFCKANGIGLVRRITGGGAIYLDPNQVGWELVISRKRLPFSTLADYARVICEAVAQGLSDAFGIEACYRPRNDIEVEGRKLCGTGGFFDGDTLFYQGTVLVDADPARIMACLNVPASKLARHGASSAAQRVTTLKELLGGSAPTIEAVHEAVVSGLCRRLGFDAKPAAPSDREEQLAAELCVDEIGTADFVFAIDDPRREDINEASRSGPGGTVTAYVRLEGSNAARRIREVLLTGDFLVTPPRVVLDLEASLRGVAASEAGWAVTRFFDATTPDLLTIAPDDFRLVVEAATEACPA